jgi:hypothetical protein
MASIAISNAVPVQRSVVDMTGRSSTAPAETPARPPAILKPDTVKLSAAAQAKMMRRAGQSPALIAATLGTNVAAVDGYLNIKVAAQVAATPTSAPPAQAAPDATGAPAAATEPAAPEPAATTGSSQTVAKG